jgi:hypothetical protein
LTLSSKNRFSEKFLWKTIILTTLLLVFSYPAFSYDIFNFMFYAKTIIIHHQNPYIVKPLDFAGVDPWLSFLHWTHRPSILPPLWTALTLIPYILGFGKFLVILWNFKILATIFYILSVYWLGKIAKILFPEKKVFIMTFFALNPLVVIESIVSAHLDIAMVAFSYLFILLLIEKKKVFSFFVLSLSVSIKYVTLILFPLILTGFRRELLLLLMIIGLLFVTNQVEIQPWYWLWILPYAALFPDKKWILVFTTTISFGLLLRYAPYFYYGHWNDPVPFIKLLVTVGFASLGLFYLLVLQFRRK